MGKPLLFGNGIVFLIGGGVGLSFHLGTPPRQHNGTHLERGPQKPLTP